MSVTLPFPTSAEQQAKLAAYTQLLLKWNGTHNLIGRSTTPEVIHRHILDSAQLAPHLPPPPGSSSGIASAPVSPPSPTTALPRVLDVGSGGGLPGIVLAILCPHLHVTLSERLGKKAAFLATAKHALDLYNVSVHAEDCATLPQASFGVVTARAVAALENLLPLTQPLLAPDGYWLLLKGQAYQAELDAYQRASAMTKTITPSITDPSGVILRLHPAP